MPANLTVGEKAVIAATVRSDDEADWIKVYRDAHCAGHEGSDKAVKQRITRLLGRPDAKLLLDAERAQREIVLRQQLLATDNAFGETVLKAAEMRTLTLNILMQQVLKEQDRVESIEGRSISGLVNACKELLRATSGAVPSAGMTDEQALAAFQALTARGQQVAGPTMQEPLKSDKPLPRDSARAMARLRAIPDEEVPKA